MLSMYDFFVPIRFQSITFFLWADFDKFFLIESWSAGVVPFGYDDYVGKKHCVENLHFIGKNYVFLV